MTERSEWVRVSGGMLRVHTAADCDRTIACPIHDPSNHALKTAPLAWRNDVRLLERICGHGLRHPDPDGLVFVWLTRGRNAAPELTAHDCDGCCAGASAPEPS